MLVKLGIISPIFPGEDSKIFETTTKSIWSYLKIEITGKKSSSLLTTNSR